MAVLVVLVVIDAAFGARAILIPLFVAAPLMVAMAGTPTATAATGAAATAAATGLGWFDGIGGSGRHIIAITGNIVGAGLATSLAVVRTRREAAQVAVAVELARVDDAMRLGKMGEWWWDRATDALRWNRTLEEILGVDGTHGNVGLRDLLRTIDRSDRIAVRRAVRDAIAGHHGFRYHHRSRWPDGSEHWVEGVGDVALDDAGEVSGVVGLVYMVDDRHRDLDERAQLEEAERRARVRADFLSAINEVLTTSLDPMEILHRVTTTVTRDVAEWVVATQVLDRTEGHPLVLVAHRDAARRGWAEELALWLQSDERSPLSVAAVADTMRRVVVTDVHTAFESDAADVLDFAGVTTIVTAPMVADGEFVGALQLALGRDRPPPTDAELDLIDDIAARCGGAITAAVQFARQRRGRIAVQTLEAVSGELATAVTLNDVSRAVVNHAREGFRAGAVALWLVRDGETSLLHTDGQFEDVGDRLIGLVQETVGVDTDDVRNERIDDDIYVLVPLRFVGRTTGIVVFRFPADRLLTDDECMALATLGVRCAGAVERAEMYERERQTALVLQRRLLPAITAVPEWVDVAARYEPARGGRIGGDWYQLIPLDGPRFAAAVGDAVGHGLTSAAAMGQLRASIATALTDATRTLGLALSTVDRFAEQGPDTVGASVVIAEFHRDAGMRYLSAGHPPMVLRPAHGPAFLLQAGRRPPLGFARGEVPTDAAAPFGPGDVVVMYTDGLVERRGHSIDEGLDRLLRVIDEGRRRSTRDLCNTIVHHMLGDDVDDDVAVLVIERRARADPAAPQ